MEEYYAYAKRIGQSSLNILNTESYGKYNINHMHPLKMFPLSFQIAEDEPYKFTEWTR
jgi:hypothetical protein